MSTINLTVSDIPKVLGDTPRTLSHLIRDLASHRELGETLASIEKEAVDYSDQESRKSLVNFLVKNFSASKVFAALTKAKNIIELVADIGVLTQFKKYDFHSDPDSDNNYYFGFTARAIDSNNVTAIKLLTLLGINFDCEDPSDFPVTPLSYALSKDKVNPDLIRSILKNLKDNPRTSSKIKAVDRGFHPNSGNVLSSLSEDYQSYPLIIAIKNKKLNQSTRRELVELLLEFGADIDGTNDGEDPSPLMAAAYMRDLDLVKFLIKEGAKLEYNSEGGSIIDYILSLAIDAENNKAHTIDDPELLKIFQELLRNGADTDNADWFNQSMEDLADDDPFKVAYLRSGVTDDPDQQHLFKK